MWREAAPWDPMKRLIITASLTASLALLTMMVATCPAMAQSSTIGARQMIESDAMRSLVNTPTPARITAAQPSDPKATELDLARSAIAAGDYAKAHTIAGRLAKGGNADAEFILGYLYQNGLGVRADIGAALRYLGDAAVKGNADAQLALGILAFEGDGVYPDYERAAGWFRLASSQGDPRGDVRLGLLYAEGVGVAANRVTAAHYFAKAAGKGDPDGAFFLALAWLNGDGLPQSYEKAAANFAAAARAGHAEAAYHLALMYESPVLGAPDVARAVSLMRAAADGGFAPANAAMGLMVHRGDAKGVAADWFEKGAHEGDPQSAFLFAVALFEGDGRAKDILGALTIADQIIASDAPDALKGQAAALKKSIRARTPGPLTLRN